MNRHVMGLFGVVALCVSGVAGVPVLTAADAESDIRINTPAAAAEFASRLANEKSQAAFGVSPFTPDAYPATLTGSRWHWGKIEPPGIGGYSAEVQFNTDGSDTKVRAVLHMDTMSSDPNMLKAPIEMRIEIENEENLNHDE